MQGKASTNNFYEEYASAIEMSKPKSKTIVDYYTLLKRLGDLTLAIIGLPFALIIIYITAVFIKLETPGPIFYAQERVGLNGRYFKVLKLRSMTIDAEKNGAQWATRNDPRVTRVGSFIRKTRIDELPQLFNVIKGDMSFVGPRPERPVFTAEFETKIPGFTRRLAVKPGLTGWAQVNGGYEISPEEKLKHDVYYIENKSLKLDLNILIKTVKVVLTGDGAR